MLNNLGKYDVVLGSNSPRRRELLNDMGVNFRVEAIKGIDESYPANLPVEEIPVYLARIKAQGHPLQENELLITADTIVVLDDAVLGKPDGEADAHRMLRALSGRDHRVISGVCVTTRDRTEAFSDTSIVRFAELTDEEIDYYIEHYRPLENILIFKKIMKNWLKYLMLVAVASMSVQAIAQTEPDTLYFYKTWKQIMDLEPTAFIVNPIIDAYSPYEIYFITGYEEVDKSIQKDYMAVSQGDSIWLINSEYLKTNFKGDVNGLNGFIPMFFNDKVVYLTANGPVTVKEVLFGNTADGFTTPSMSYYYIDFLNHRVKRVTHSYLSELLTDFHDLKVRYEGMKDYKKQYVIEDYFYKYIDRASDDVMHPYILDLVGY